MAKTFVGYKYLYKKCAPDRVFASYYGDSQRFVFPEGKMRELSDLRRAFNIDSSETLRCIL